MNFRDYMEHPMGKGASTGSRIQRDELIKQYNWFIQDHKINHKLVKKGNRFFAMIQIESRKVRGFFFDNILEFSNVNSSQSMLSIDNEMRVYTNSPSFNFTYAYVFNKNKMIIPELKNKYSKLAIKDEPEIRNSYNIISYDRVLFFSILYIMRQKLFNTVDYTETNVSDIFDKLDTPEVCLTKYNRELAIRNELERKAKERENRESTKTTREVDKRQPSLSASKHNHVKSKIRGKSKISGKSKR